MRYLIGAITGAGLVIAWVHYWRRAMVWLFSLGDA